MTNEEKDNVWCNLQKEDLQGEVWKTIDGFNNYMISSLGRVKSLVYKNGSYIKKEEYPIILKQRFDTKGYCTITIVSDSKIRKTLKLHRLVAKAFIPNPENKPQVNHIFNIKTHNFITDLEWTTNIDNMRHSYEKGYRDGMVKGEKNGRAILKECDVIYIYTNPDRKYCSDLMNEFKLEKSTIHSIYSGKNWNYLTKDLDKNMISSNDRFYKLFDLKLNTVRYFNNSNDLNSFLNISGGYIFTIIKKNQTYKNRWKIEYISYDEYKANS